MQAAVVKSGDRDVSWGLLLTVGIFAFLLSGYFLCPAFREMHHTPPVPRRCATPEWFVDEHWRGKCRGNQTPPAESTDKV